MSSTVCKTGGGGPTGRDTFAPTLQSVAGEPWWEQEWETKAARNGGKWKKIAEALHQHSWQPTMTANSISKTRENNTLMCIHLSSCVSTFVWVFECAYKEAAIYVTFIEHNRIAGGRTRNRTAIVPAFAQGFWERLPTFFRNVHLTVAAEGIFECEGGNQFAKALELAGLPSASRWLPEANEGALVNDGPWVRDSATWALMKGSEAPSDKK